MSAFLMLRENASSVAEGLRLALERYGLPGQVLTDNGKVFTGRFNQPPWRCCSTGSCASRGWSIC